MARMGTGQIVITRRGLLAASGAVAVAAVGDSLDAKPSSADVPASARFDLTQPSYDLFRNKPLAQQTVMQSFTFDNVNRRLFVAQLRNGSTSDDNGDLCVTQLDFSGNQVGHMFLTGFGHGVSIGVEPAGSASYLWTEVDSVNSRGTQLARFRFASGTTLSHTSSALEKHLPIAGIDTVTCATDPINQRLIMRYRINGAFRYAVYNLADIRNGVYDRRLADIAQPSGLGTFQGYAVYGQYLYMLDGDPYSATNPSPGNAHVSSVSLNGGPLTRVQTNAGGSLTYREPEGMAVYRTIAGETRLFLGFASGASGDRRANIFYKNVLI
jgi:hypothetical protein